MWKSLLRASLSILLFAGAVGLLIYGVRFHVVEVSYQYEEEQEIPVAPPEPFPGPEGAPPPFGQPPFEQPGEHADGPQPFVDPFQAVPPHFLQTIKAKVVVTEHEDYSEPALVREVTFGGVRLTSGTLMRTYTGQPPSLCPT